MNILCIGAHPDDAEFHAGGTLVKWVRAGHQVHVISMTRGDAGHQEQAGEVIAARRAVELTRAAEIGGYACQILDNADGQLMPTLDLRRDVVRLIREFKADVVLTHRPCDYHPDHRYTAALVQDAAFMVTVPHFAPEAPALRTNPIFLYMMDRFTRPVPLRPDLAVGVDAVMEIKWALLDAMDSQVYEWLPWLHGTLDKVPPGLQERGAWLRETWDGFFRRPADSAREALGRWYGPEAANIAYAELFEVCEYGRVPGPEDWRTLCPFLPRHP